MSDLEEVRALAYETIEIVSDGAEVVSGEEARKLARGVINLYDYISLMEAAIAGRYGNNAVTEIREIVSKVSNL